jgi:hypothetical protein
MVEQRVTLQARKRGKAHLDRAFDHRLKGELQDAKAELAQAVIHDPELRKERGALSLAGDLTGASQEQAIDALLQESKTWNVRRQRVVIGPDILTLVLQIVITVAVFAIITATLGAGFIGSLNTVVNSGTGAREVLNEVTGVLSSLRPGSPSVAIPLALLTMVILVFWNTIIYMIGAAMGGTGSVVRFFRLMLAVQLVVYIVLVFVQVVFLVPFLSTAPGSTQASWDQGWISLSLSGICGVLAVVVQAYFAGRVHGIGLVRGFMSLLAASIVFICLFTGFTFTRFR